MTTTLPTTVSPDTTGYPDDTDVWIDWEVTETRYFRKKFTLGELRAVLDCEMTDHRGNVSNHLMVLTKTNLPDHECDETEYSMSDVDTPEPELWLTDPNEL